MSEGPIPLEQWQAAYGNWEELEPWQRDLAELVRNGQVRHQLWGRSRQRLVQEALEAHQASEYIINLAAATGVVNPEAVRHAIREARHLRGHLIERWIEASYGLSDDPALGPDAARWTPEDDG